ncbi:MAG: hypothetical protein RRC34_02920 [Lentisphaeria bacterium]|nr:hypothetical protein [Lentisphaeria bacterium]
MAVVGTAQLIARGRSGRKDRGGQRSYRETYLVKTDTDTDSAVTVLGASGLPALNAGFTGDTSAIVMSLAPKVVGIGRRNWHVDVEYKTLQPTDFTADPLDTPPDISWGSYTLSEIAEEDKDGAAILNTAGDPYDPPIEIDRHYPLVTISRYQASYSPSSAFSVRDSLNSAAVTIAGLALSARQGLMIDYDSVSETIDGTTYQRVTYRIMCKPGSGWVYRTVSRGYRALVGGERKVIYIDGEPASKPVHLDAAGAVLAVGATPYVQTHYINKETSWSTLALPATVTG